VSDARVGCFEAINESYSRGLRHCETAEHVSTRMDGQMAINRANQTDAHCQGYYVMLANRE